MTRTTRTLATTAMLAAAAVAGGCAPSIGPGLAVGLGPGGSLGLTSSTCLLHGTSSPYASMHSNAAAIAGARMQQIGALESRFRAGSLSGGFLRESWKRLAQGGC